MMSSFEDCCKYALVQLKQPTFKDKQLETLHALYDGYDCISILPTGYGKSLIFQALPFFFGKLRCMSNLITIVVSPLTSLMQDQVLSLCEKGIKACYLNCEGTAGKTYLLSDKFIQDTDEGNDEDSDVMVDIDIHLSRNVSLSSLCDGDFNIIYAHPETLLLNRRISSILRNKVYKQRVCAIVVDEVHMICEWGESFRKEFKRLAELTAIFPRPRTVHLAVTGTATESATQQIVKDLQFSDVKIVSTNPDRENIFLCVKKRLPNNNRAKKLDDILRPIIDDLFDLRSDFPVTICYVRKLQDIAYCYDYAEDNLQEFQYEPLEHQIPENRLFAQFHRNYATGMKEYIVSELRKPNPKIRLVFATVALGMGLNAPSIRQVIHFEPPTSIENYFQEVGRAGRNGVMSTALLYYNNSDIAGKEMSSAIVNYCKNDKTCLRKCIMEYFGFPTVKFDGPSEHCCTNCKNGIVDDEIVTEE